MTVEVSVSSGKPCAAEAPESELSWATGSGLPICCISGLAVAEESRGSRCRALEEATVSKLFDNNYWIFTKWLCGHETCRQIDSVTTVVHLWGGDTNSNGSCNFYFLDLYSASIFRKSFFGSSINPTD